MNCEVSSLGKKKPNGIGSRIGHVSQCNTDASSVPRYVNTSNKSHCVQPTSFFQISWQIRMFTDYGCYTTWEA